MDLPGQHNQIDTRLNELGLPRRATYSTKETQAILAVTKSALGRLVHNYSRTTENGKTVKRFVKSTKTNNGRRFSFYDISAYITRAKEEENRLNAPLLDPLPASFDGLHPAGLPCPYCGCRGVSPVCNDGGQKAAFRCDGCGSTGPIATDWQDALSGWNRRL